MTWLYGIDTSFDQITDSEAQLLRQAGVRVAAQCLWTGGQQPAPRVTNLRTYKNAGIAIAGYISLTATGQGSWHAQQGRNGVPDDLWADLKHVFIDIELQGIQAGNVRQAVNFVQGLGKPKSIYTSWNAWKNYMGDPTTFTDCLLWNAFWDNDEDIDFASAPFGGWTVDKVICEQWSGGTNVQGVYADRNQFRADAFGLAVAPPSTPVPVPPPPPTDAQWLGAAGAGAALALLYTQRAQPDDALKAKVRYLVG